MPCGASLAPRFAWPPLPLAVSYAIKPAAAASDASLLCAVPRAALSALWQALVLGDGSLTRTFGLLTGSPTAVTVLDAAILPALADDDADSPPEARDLSPPLVRRRVWLENERGERLGYAVSWWGASDYAKLMPAPQLPIGTSLGTAQLEVFRRLSHVWRCARPTCDEAPSADVWRGLCGNGAGPDDVGDVWGRTYGLVSGGRPVAVICELFAPRLAHYLGPSCERAADCTAPLGC